MDTGSAKFRYFGDGPDRGSVGVGIADCFIATHERIRGESDGALGAPESNVLSGDHLYRQTLLLEGIDAAVLTESPYVKRPPPPTTHRVAGNGGGRSLARTVDLAAELEEHPSPVNEKRGHLPARPLVPAEVLGRILLGQRPQRGLDDQPARAGRGVGVERTLAGRGDEDEGRNLSGHEALLCSGVRGEVHV